MEIHIYRLNDHLDIGLMHKLRDPLQAVFGIPVVIVEQPFNAPAAAFDAIREQWLARKLVQALAAFPGATADQQSSPQQQHHYFRLGIADCDLFETGLNYVVSYSLPEAECAVVSLARLDNRFYGFPVMDKGMFRRRCTTAAVHELGKLMGLKNCSQPQCVMRKSESLPELDAKGWRLCDGCREALRRQAARPPLPPSSPTVSTPTRATTASDAEGTPTVTSSSEGWPERPG